jgi:hypothetical protein
VADTPPGLSQLRWQPPNDVEGVLWRVIWGDVEAAGDLEDMLGVVVDVGLVRV